MSEFKVEVVRIGKTGKCPNADTLSITQVGGRYPVIFKSGSFNEGDLAVHIPPDALVDTTRPEFDFLASKATDNRFRVRFAKLRGVPSFGFLVPAPEGSRMGDDLRATLGVEKYDPGPCYQLGGEIAGGYERIPQEGVIPLYDIEGLRKYENLIPRDCEVVVTEKIHGSNGRWAYLDGVLYCGSRTKFRKDSVWNRMAEKYELEKVLSKYPGLVLYGEVYGSKMQDLTYGCAEGEQRVVFFDAYAGGALGRWKDSDWFFDFCAEFGLPTCPVLYRGPYEPEKMFELAEGLTVLGDGAHVREGVVIKPTEERWDPRMGRVFLKLVGEQYLLRAKG